MDCFQKGILVLTPKWESPEYKLKSKTGKLIKFDVTRSISTGLSPHEAVETHLISICETYKISRILDFGAGVLRHTASLLKHDFQVCAVEFKEAFALRVGKQRIKELEKDANFSKLVWPNQFKGYKKKFQLALISFVLQTMPIPSERHFALKQICKKLGTPGLILYLSRHGYTKNLSARQKCNDGYYMSPKRKIHSFLADFNREETEQMFNKAGFRFLKSFSRKGQEQVYLFQRKDYMKDDIW